MTFTCPTCGMTSHNPNDERERYCGNCHEFVEDRKPSLYDNAIPMPAHWPEIEESS